MAMPRLFTHRRYQCITYPYVPSQVDFTHLREFNQEGRGFLIPEAEKKLIKRVLANARDRRYSKWRELRAFGLPDSYSVVKCDNHFYALYLGKDHGLGRGVKGKTKLLQHMDTGEWIAIKVQHNNDDDKLFESKADDEFDALKLVQQARGCVKDECSRDRPRHSILMSLARGVPLDHYCEHARLSTVEWLQIAINCIQAIKSIHERFRLLHRDIKFENMIIDPVTGDVYLVDFGFARTLPANSDELRLYTEKGTPLYQGTPDLLAYECAEGIYNLKTEIFAMGKTIEDILLKGNSVHIFDDKMRREIKKYIISHLIAVRPHCRTNDSDALAFMMEMKNEALRTAPLIPVGIINVAVYLNLSAVAREQMQQALRAVRKVILIDTVENRQLPLYSELQHTLTRLGIAVSYQVYVHSNLTCALITAIGQDKNWVDAPIYRHVYLTTEGLASTQTLMDYNIIPLTINKVGQDYRRDIQELINRPNASPRQRGNVMS